MKKITFFSVMAIIATFVFLTIQVSCESDDLFGLNEGLSEENLQTRSATDCKFLDIKSTVYNEMSMEDWEIVFEAISRLTIYSESGLSFVQNQKCNKLNMSDRLFDFIKTGFEQGNKLLQEEYHGQQEKKRLVRRKSSANEINSHQCTGHDCVGHSISHYLNLDIEVVNATIHSNIPSYPQEGIDPDQIESTLNLFGSFSRQDKYFSSTSILPCVIPGIILIPRHALNGIFIREYGDEFVLVCYDDQYVTARFFIVSQNKCASSPLDVTSELFGYYR